MPINNQFTNFATATTLITIGSGALSVTLASGNGALFPVLAGGQYFYMVLLDSLTAPTVREIVKVNARAGDILTIVRAQDSTSAFAWPAGSFASLRLVNASIQDIVAASGAGIAISGTPATGQAAEWTNATTVQGVSAVGTGSYVKATAPTIVSPTLTTPIFDTATGVNVNLSGTDTVNRFVLSGNISSPAWTTSGLRIKGIPATFTDTTSSGTVAAAYTDSFGGNTIAASSATTFTNYITAYFKEPVSGGANVTLSNKWALGSDSLRVGIANPFTITNAGVVTAGGQITSTVTAGTAPLVIASTTLVPNLYVARALIADSATVNANLTGPITSVGNTTSVAAQTGTGSTFVMATSPTLVTPILGAAAATSISLAVGSAAAPSVNWAGASTSGLFYAGSGYTVGSSLGSAVFSWNPLGVDVAAALAYSIAGDTFLTRASANVFAQKNGANAQEFQIFGTTTGPKYLSLKHDGTNAIVGANSGAINFGTGASITPQVQVIDTASAVNFHQLTGSATGNAINWTVAGTDANPNIRVANKGTGGFLVDSGSAAPLYTLQVNCTGANGASILLTGNGGTTPNKYIRSQNGVFQVLNSAYSAPILSITDAGTLSINTNLSLSYNGTNALVVPLSGQLAFNTAAIATTATTGFHCTVSGAGAPTGVPASIPSGQIPTYYDSTNNRIYFYNGSWRSVAVA